MNGLSVEEEAALTVAAMQPDEGVAPFADDTYPSLPFIRLREAGFITMDTGMSQTLVILQGITPPGAAHYQEVIRLRRRCASISEEANQLISFIAANGKIKKKGKEATFFPVDVKRQIEEFQELSQAGLLKVSWADNIAYTYELTDKGRSYIEGWFIDEGAPVNVSVSQQFNPVLNNDYHGESNATAVAYSETCLYTTIGKIASSDLPDEIKHQAQNCATGLDEAAKQGDVGAFASKLKDAATLVEGATKLGSILFPLIQQLLALF